MKMMRSKTGIPYIEFDDKNRLAFAQKGQRGYKSLVFSGILVGPIRVKNGNGRNIELVQTDKISFFTSFGFDKVKRNHRKGNIFLGKESTDLLTEIFMSKVDKFGYISEEGIEKIAKDINGLTIVS